MKRKKNYTELICNILLIAAVSLYFCAQVLQYTKSSKELSYEIISDTYMRGDETAHSQQVTSAKEKEINVSFDVLDPGSVATYLHKLLTHPTYNCRRLVRVGGRSCVKAYDGSKLVCFDDVFKPTSGNCLIYSFGVGNDFTFDEQMQDFGCEVHAFDQDDDHDVYDHRLGPSLFFHKVRIGAKTRFVKYCSNERGCGSINKYMTMKDIRRSLGHEGRTVFYFKMDIEGEEWDVIGDIVRKTRLLQSVSQLSLEIHFDDIYEGSDEVKRKTMLKYIKTIESLHEIGFVLANYETNFMSTKFTSVRGVNMSLYSEILLLNKKLKTNP